MKWQYTVDLEFYKLYLKNTKFNAISHLKSSHVFLYSFNSCLHDTNQVSNIRVINIRTCFSCHVHLKAKEYDQEIPESQLLKSC